MVDGKNENPVAEDETQSVEEKEIKKKEETKEKEQQESPVTEEEQSPVDEKEEALKRLENERNELKNRLLRAQADYENFRRRTREEKASLLKYRSQYLAEKCLPVLDNFERALNIQVEKEETKRLLEGMEIIYRQLKEAFSQENIREVEADGQPFDPEMHQAVMQVESDEHETNRVVEVMQKGYQLHDRVIRPAMVKVTN